MRLEKLTARPHVDGNRIESMWTVPALPTEVRVFRSSRSHPTRRARVSSCPTSVRGRPSTACTARPSTTTHFSRSRWRYRLDCRPAQPAQRDGDRQL
jgi:hypothetical protein